MTVKHQLPPPTPSQQPPFLICVPISQSAALEIDALLDGLGNPADTPIRDALDACRVIHFLSLTVVRDRDGDDPPFLVAHVAADGESTKAIAALVEHAGALLLPVFRAAAGVEDKPALRWLLERYLLKPVAAALPLWPHRATGLPFQGTPGLTVRQIKEDERTAHLARAVVDGFGAQGRSPALSYLEAARTATGLQPRARSTPRPLSFMTSDTPPSGSANPTLAIIGVLVLDWSFLFIVLLAVLSVNMLSLLDPIFGQDTSDSSRIILSIPFALILGIIVNSIFGIIKNVLGFMNISSMPRWLLIVTGLMIVLVTIFVFKAWLIYSTTFVVRQNVRNIVLSPFAVWSTAALGCLSLVLFLFAVAGLLYWRLRYHETRDKPCDADPDPRRLAEVIRGEDRPPYKQNHMVSAVTISPGFFRQFITLPLGLYAASLTVRAGLFKTGFLAGLGTIHFIQWARIPSTSQLVFAADYDGSWQSYLEDAVTLLPTGATGIWSNAKGFPKTFALFFKGADDGDRFKRWVRRTMIPTRFWYSAYPHLTTTDIRCNAEIRCGLNATALTPSEADGWLKLFGAVPRPVGEIETDQIQGVALSGYRKLVESVALAVTFPSDLGASACRAWLAGVTARIHFGDAQQDKTAMAVAVSASGLKGLGLGTTHPLAAGFSLPFVMGMADKARANVLGDVGENDPEKWEWGGPDNPVDAVLLLYAVDAATLEARLDCETAECVRMGMHAPYQIRLRRWPRPTDPRTKKLIPLKEPFGFVDGVSQPSIRGLASSVGAMANDRLEPGEFILGYPDGRNQFPPTPQVLATHDPHNLLPDLPADFPPPPTEAPVRDLGRNGSYLVIRQLKQEVARFKSHVGSEAAKLGKHPDWVAAKMVGRWPNGAPLVQFPHAEPPNYDPIKKDENFLFGRDDPQGLACPFGAHIRRANPRDQFNPDNKTQMSITNRHRILRRGRSYVDDKSNAETEAQGLLFMCLNADLDRQFEFLQQTWIGSTSFGPLCGEADPLMGTNRADGTYTIPTPDGPRQLTGLPSFVSVIGGGYFFLPGRQALNYLSARR
ncbi:MAG TPA: hypothetical protein VGH86_01290 [Phenylobacterium sp.]